LFVVACSQYDLHAKPIGAGPPVVEDTAPTPDTAPPADPYSGCDDGFFADYYNLPADHPDVEGESTGVRTGDSPYNHDWYDSKYWVWRTNDKNLNFGDGWFPVDQGLPGDPFYFAVHWHATLDVSADGSYPFSMGSDDDSWAFVDGVMVADLGGIHGLEATSFPVDVTKGQHTLDLFMAERHTSDSGFWFIWDAPEVTIYACP
jgi:fibro-slime domain-containing protein